VQALIDFIETFILGPLNYIDRIEGLFKATWYRDSGHRFAIPRIDKGGKYSLSEAEELLGRYRIAVYCRTYDANNRYFRVKKRQARWAEYLLLHAGVELRGAPFDARNAHYVTQHPVGWLPKPWSAQGTDEQDDSHSTVATTKNPASTPMRADDGWSELKKLVDW
jgi:hypothetical protein